MKNKWIGLLALTLLGCKTMDESQWTSQILPLTELNHPVEIQEASLIRRATIVHPEKDIVLGRVKKVIVGDSLLYLLDSQKMEVCVVNMQGKLVGKISAQGRGDKEYLELTDFFVDRTNRSINILSRINKKLYVYNLSDYKLKTVRPLPLSFSQMVKTKNGYVGYMANYSERKDEPYNLWLLNNNLEIMGRDAKINPILESRSSWNHTALSVYNGVCYAVNEMDFQVYCIDKEITPLYLADFGNYNLPEQSGEMLDNQKTQFLNQNMYICDILNYQETKDKMLIYTHFQGEYQLILYDKNREEVSRIPLNQGIDDFLPLGFGSIVGMDSEHIVTVIDGETVNRVYKGYDEYNDYEKLYPKQVEHLRKLIRNPEGNDNVAFIIYDL